MELRLKHAIIFALFWRSDNETAECTLSESCESIKGVRREPSPCPASPQNHGNDDGRKGKHVRDDVHPFDFDDDCILVGHDGPHHIQLADGKPVVRSLKKYHGKEGSGASVEFKLKEGDFTMLGINQNGDGSFRFVIGEGISNAGPIPPTGNTNTRAAFAPDTPTFIKNWCMAGPTHHFALGTGKYAGTLEKLGKVLGVTTVVVK